MYNVYYTNVLCSIQQLIVLQQYRKKLLFITKERGAFLGLLAEHLFGGPETGTAICHTKNSQTKNL